MAGYDPQKARGRHEIPEDEPAPVDGLLGPAPDEGGRAPVLAHDAARPTVRQVVPVPARPADEPQTDVTADVTADADAAVADEAVEPVIDLDAGAEPEIVVDEPTTDAPTTDVAIDAPSVAPTISGEALHRPGSPSPAARVAAILAVVAGLVLFVLWRRRRSR